MHLGMLFQSFLSMGSIMQNLIFEKIWKKKKEKRFEQQCLNPSVPVLAMWCLYASHSLLCLLEASTNIANVVSIELGMMDFSPTQ